MSKFNPLKMYYLYSQTANSEFDQKLVSFIWDMTHCIWLDIKNVTDQKPNKSAETNVVLGSDWCHWKDISSEIIYNPSILFMLEYFNLE